MNDLKIGNIEIDAVRYACRKWHYSKSILAGSLVKYGVWENDKFIGVILYSKGANPNIGKPYDLDHNKICELTRIALREHLNFVSKILMMTLRQLKKDNDGLKLVISYADSSQGHLGKIYQATNWIYVGDSFSTYIKLNNKVFHPKTIFNRYKTISINKLRNIDKNVETVRCKRKYKYLYPLNREMRKKILKLQKPYPKELNASEA